VLHTDDRLVTTGDTCAGGQPVKLSRRMSTLACADGARATAAAVIAARTHGLPNLIAVLRDSSHPAHAAKWSPLLSDRERGS
jgi:hypothetical protein